MNSYVPEKTYDEMFDPQGQARPHYASLQNFFGELGAEELQRRRRAADLSFLHQGVTFTVYGHEDSTEKVFPYDIVPRIITAREWNQIEEGLKQRITALNLFLSDIYHVGKIIKDKVLPAHLIYSCRHYLRQMRGVKVPKNVYVSIVGTDLVRADDGQFYVLEDNLRVPSGVSYMLANRKVMRETFPTLFSKYEVRSVDSYSQALLMTLRSLSNLHHAEPTVVVLTPGIYNSAYYEHALLAREMGVQLVEGRDLLVHDNVVYMKTTSGLRRVDVIYRRLDDDFIDPLAFRPDSALGVPGLFNAYRHGKVTLANSIGTGVADDKALYAYVPQIIKYYLKQDPILPNVQTYILTDPKQREHVLANIDKLVIKAVGESGGYGMLIGPHSTKKEQEEMAAAVRKEPRNFIAQPTLDLSQAPCQIGESLVPRRIDLRPYVLYGEKIRIVPGGLTRVALKEGSLVVNSSQGGGSKDTWVLAEDKQ
ncbi:MAG TPA: circularly permuted type 2 ATP-grasp protein [Phycisphaerales bacterium]|nr:circularly permuted type 2 ATP-grasp protein [Phycisphaerales bacterium]